MAKEAWFKTSDGREVVCNEGSVAFDLMSKDGSFSRIGGSGVVPEPSAETETETAGEAAEASKGRKTAGKSK